MAPTSEWFIDEALIASVFQLRHLPASAFALQDPLHCSRLLEVLGSFLLDQQVLFGRVAVYV